MRNGLATGDKFPHIMGTVLDGGDTSLNEKIGGYLNDDPVFFQPANFIIAPDGSVAIASYSNGPIGQLTPTKCQEFIVAVGGGRSSNPGWT